MAAVYPGAVPSFTGMIGTSSSTLDSPSLITLAQKLADEIAAIAAELGIDPSGTSYTTVKARLDAIVGASDATSSVKGVVQLAGDLAGTAAAPTVPSLANKAPLLLTQSTKTASYTLVVGDVGALIEMNTAGAVNLTVPTNATAAFAVGTMIRVRQYGAGVVTITPAAGVTLRSRVGLRTAGQYAEAKIIKRASDEWVASGDLQV